MFEEALGKDHVHFMDAHPDIRTFMKNVNKDVTDKAEAVVEKRGRKMGDLPDIQRLKKEDVKVKHPKVITREPWKHVVD